MERRCYDQGLELLSSGQKLLQCEYFGLLLARGASKEILIMRARKDLAPELIELVRFIMRQQDQRSQFQCELSIKLQNDKIILNF